MTVVSTCACGCAGRAARWPPARRARARRTRKPRAATGAERRGRPVQAPRSNSPASPWRRRRPKPWRLALEAVGTVALDDTRTARVGALVEGVVEPRTSTSATGCGRARCWPACTATRCTTAGATTARPSPTVGASSRNWPSPTESGRAHRAPARRQGGVDARGRAGAGGAGQCRASSSPWPTPRCSAPGESLEHLGIPIGPTTEGRPPRSSPVRTPQGGVVLEKLVTTGTTVTPGTPLFVVSDTSTLWVLAEIDEAALAQVKVGAPVQVDGVGLSRPSASRRRSRCIGDTINPETRRVVVAVRGARTRDGRLKPGMFARVQLEGAASGADGAPAGGCRAGHRRAPGRVRPGRRRPVRGP